MNDRNKKPKNRGSVGNNRKISEDFLLKNKQKPDVVETDSELQYTIVKKEQDSDKKVYDGCTIIVHQRITLVNGTILDDTYKRNKPSEDNFDELIPGYKEGIQLMNVGDRYKFFIPPHLAWGKKGTGNTIPPESVLIMDVKLIDVI